MRWFVTGAHGFLGRHVCELLADVRPDDRDERGERDAPDRSRHDARGQANDDVGRRVAGPDGHHVVAPTSADVDVRDAAAVRAAVVAARPDAVLHLAYRRDDPASIVEGSEHVAAAAVACGARLVHVSTDVVFADCDRPRTERDRPEPVHDYGRTKLAAERRVVAVDPSAVVVRTSLLYGDRHVAGIQRDVADAIGGRSTMRFFTDEVRCPIHAGDLAAALIRLAGDLRDVHGPLHVAGPHPLTRAATARRFARHLGLDEQLVPTASAAALGLDRERPLRVVLDSSRAARLGLAARPIEEALGR